MSQPPAQIEPLLIPGVPSSAHRIEGSDQVVLGNGSPFRLVGIHKSIAGPPVHRHASFHPRLKPSAMALFIPVPPRGVTRWAASPTRKASPMRNLSAIAAEKLKWFVATMRTGRSGTLALRSDPGDQQIVGGRWLRPLARLPVEGKDPPVGRPAGNKVAGPDCSVT